MHTPEPSVHSHHPGSCKHSSVLMCRVTLYQDAHQTPGSVPAVLWRGSACDGTYASATTTAIGGSSDSDDTSSAPLASYMSDESEWQDSGSDYSGAMSVSSAGSAGPVLQHIHRALTDPEANLPAVEPRSAAKRVTAPQAPPTRQPAAQPPAGQPAAAAIPLVHRLPLTSPSVQAAAADEHAGSSSAAPLFGVDPFAAAAAAEPPQRTDSPAAAPEAAATPRHATELSRGPLSRGGSERTRSGTFTPAAERTSSGATAHPAERTRSGTYLPVDRPRSSAPPGSRLHASGALRSHGSSLSATAALRTTTSSSGAAAEDSPPRTSGAPSMPSYCDECCEGATFKVRL